MVNPGPKATSATTRARGADGSTIWEETHVLDPGRPMRLTIPDRGTQFVWLEIVADDPIAAARQTRFPGAAQADTGASPAPRWSLPSTMFGGAWSSYLVAANPNAAPAHLRVRWIAEGAAPDEKAVNVPARGRIALDVPLMASGAIAGADVTADEPVALVRSAYEREGVRTTTEGATPR
jgi:hypothetical protein